MSFVGEQGEDGGGQQAATAGRAAAEPAKAAARQSVRQFNDAEQMEIHPALLEGGDWGLGTDGEEQQSKASGPSTSQKRQVQVTLPDGTQAVATEVLPTEPPVDPEEVAEQLKALDEITVRPSSPATAHAQSLLLL